MKDNACKMNLPDVPAEYYLCWSSIAIGISVPLILVFLGLIRKDRRLFSLGFVAGSVFVFYLAYWFHWLLLLDDPDYSMVPAYAWVILGCILIFGIVLFTVGILTLMGKKVLGKNLDDWSHRPQERS